MSTISEATSNSNAKFSNILLKELRKSKVTRFKEIYSFIPLIVNCQLRRPDIILKNGAKAVSFEGNSGEGCFLLNYYSIAFF